MQRETSEGQLAFRSDRLSTPLEAATLIRRLRGRSQSILVEGKDRRLYVVKLKGDYGEYGNLASELIGNSLCGALGLSTPQGRFIRITDDFIQCHPEAWRRTPRGPVRPSAGLHFATAFVGSATGLERPFQVLLDASRNEVRNRDQFCGMYLFDVWANHLDRRQSIYLPERGRRNIQAVFVDNGLLFGGESWRSSDPLAQMPFRQQDAINVEWSTAGAHDWLERFSAVIPAALARIMKFVPPDWCAYDLNRLEATLLDRLEMIETIIQPFVRRERL